MRKVHVYTRVDDGEHLNMVHAARVHAGGQPGHSTLGVESVANLRQSLIGMLAEPQLDELDFHTHGVPGAIGLGADSLTVNALDQFRNQGFERLFKAGADVTFLGCNVAESAIGECFLAEFGAIFLRGGGGTVRGSTSLGFQDPLFSGDIVHFWGEWVTAHVREGGAVRLHNERHLHPYLIRREIQRLRSQRAQDSTVPTSGGTAKPGVRGVVEPEAVVVSPYLVKAEDYIEANGGRPSYRQVYHAYDFLSRARNRRRVEPDEVRALRWGE